MLQKVLEARLYNRVGSEFWKIIKICVLLCFKNIIVNAKIPDTYFVR